MRNLVGHNDRHLSPVYRVVRAEVAIVVADHDIHCLEDLDCLDVVVLLNVGEGRSAGADYHHAGVTAVQAASMMMRALGYFKYTEDYKDGFGWCAAR